MELQLIALLLLASPMSAPPHARFAQLAARSESISAVEATAARFRSMEAVRSQARYAEDLADTAPSLAPSLGVVRAALWIDSLPIGVGAQDGGITLSFRFRV